MMLRTGRRSTVKNEVRITFGGQTIIHALMKFDETQQPVAVDYLHLGEMTKGVIQHGILQWQGVQHKGMPAIKSSTRAPFASEARVLYTASSLGRIEKTAAAARWRELDTRLRAGGRFADEAETMHQLLSELDAADAFAGTWIEERWRAITARIANATDAPQSRSPFRAGATRVTARGVTGSGASLGVWDRHHDPGGGALMCKSPQPWPSGSIKLCVYMNPKSSALS